MSSKAVKKGRGGGRPVRPGRGAGSRREPATNGTPEYLALRRAQALLRSLSLADLRVVMPVLEKYDLLKAGGAKLGAGRTGESHPPVPFSVFAEHMETLANLIPGVAGVESPECCALGGFICNHGTGDEMAEALLALMPIATRVYLRYKAGNDALLAESRAAVKASKK